MHEHTACPLISLQWLLGPHGDGLHGWTSIGAKNIKFQVWNIYRD